MAFISVKVFRSDRLKQMGIRAKDLKPVGPEVYTAMRFGRDSVRDQFLRGTEIGPTGSRSWPPTKPFGTRQMPARTLHARGDYESAWLGGPGGLQRTNGKSFEIGVNARAFPHARVFQKTIHTTVRPKKRTKSGDWAMRLFLGMTYGVWISKARLAKGLRIEPRRVSLNPTILRRVASVLRNYITGTPQRKAA